MISGSDRAFLDRREQLLRSWPLVGGALVAVVLGGGLWLWFDVPQLVNPWHVVALIEAEELDAATALLMAAMLPVMSLALLTLLLVGLVLAFVAFSNERRLLRIVREAQRNADESP